MPPRFRFGRIAAAALLFLSAAGITQAAETIDATTRLAALCKVWGFLKYYHPVVARGDLDWDEILIYDILRAQAASTRDALGRVLDGLIAEAGGVGFLRSPRVIPKGGNDDPLFAWMRNDAVFAPYVTFKLELLLETFAAGANHYVSHDIAENVALSNEKLYYVPLLPDGSHRLLTLFRYWNVIQYFFPYKHVIGRDWEEVLDEFIPKMIAADTKLGYHLAVCELAASIQDTHAFTSSPVIEDYRGSYLVPFEAEFIENQTVVTKILPNYLSQASDLSVGDIVIAADGTPIEDLRAERGRYIGASNEAARQRYVHLYLFQGKTDRLVLTVSSGGAARNIVIVRIPPSAWIAPAESKPVWRLLDANIGYVDMRRLQPGQVAECMAGLKATKAIIFDQRNYPNWTIPDLANYLYPKAKAFAKFTKPLLSSPGHFREDMGDPYGPSSANPDYYKGKVVVLANEKTLSQAEYTCMFFQGAPDAVVIGSQTAGADGEVSSLKLPGGITTRFSGIGVYYPDGRETQRIGIVPDIEVRPTIAGIRAGRDEVLERALEYLARIGG